MVSHVTTHPGKNLASKVQFLNRDHLMGSFQLTTPVIYQNLEMCPKYRQFFMQDFPIPSQVLIILSG
jgi:hypothetical protein